MAQMSAPHQKVLHHTEELLAHGHTLLTMGFVQSWQVRAAHHAPTVIQRMITYLRVATFRSLIDCNLQCSTAMLHCDPQLAHVSVHAIVHAYVRL